jgi:hypothetical protein
MSPVRPTPSDSAICRIPSPDRSRRRSIKPPLLRRGAALALGLAFAGASVAGCASASPYNPQNLDAAQLGRIADICQTTMGLRDWEAPSPVWGAAQDPHLDPGENHYQGCIASLSDAEFGADQGQALARADMACSARGYSEGSPALAECVLQSEGAPSTRTAERPYDGARFSETANRKPASSFYYASPVEISRRERAACAELGLNPLYAAFDNCVANMDETFFRIDNPSF